MRCVRTGHARIAVVLGAAVLAACDSGERSAPETDVDTPETRPLSVTVPPERLTPFCQAMIDLGDRIANDPPDDPAAEILSVYESLVEIVPPEIEADFLTVLTRLRSGTPGPTPATAEPSTTVASDPNATLATTPFAEEGYDPDDDPALRLNAYVQFACNDAVNNPGPAATQPGVTPAP